MTTSTLEAFIEAYTDADEEAAASPQRTDFAMAHGGPTIHGWTART